jgi:hypothetical protein
VIRPSFQSVIHNQRIAHHRLNETPKIARSETEIGHYRRSLHPVPLGDVELPKLPLVRAIGDTARYVVLGEVAQMPGKVLLLDVISGVINLSYALDQLELALPDDV